MKIEDYLPLILKVIKPYSNNDKHLEEDLIQEGFLGIIEAKNHYDAQKGTKFSSYAYYWIRKRILAYLGKEIEQGVGENNFPFLEDVADVECNFDEEKMQLNLPENMPDEERKILDLVFVGNKSLHEVAEVLGYSRERVRRLKSKALRRLRVINK